MTIRNSSAQLVLAVLLLTTIGCGEQPSAVSGELAFRGQPIESGSVRFFPVESTKGTGAVAEITNGHFEIAETQGLVAGKYMVQIMAVRKTGRMIKPDLLVEAMPQEEEFQIIPEKYNSRSELHTELLPGQNTYDQQLAP